MIVDWFRDGRTEQRQLALQSAVLTALTITGVVVSAFSILDGMALTHAVEDLPLWLAIAIGVPMLALPFALGGGIWGWGTAYLFDHPRWPAARTGALSITGMFILLEVPVHFSQALPIPSWMPLDAHGGFTLVFATEIALVSGVASARLARRLGFDHGHRSLGAKVGLSGALGTVIGSLLALGLGFRVGHPPAENMVWALYVVVAVSGLKAGWLLGWLLANHHQGTSTDSRLVEDETFTRS